MSKPQPNITVLLSRFAKGEDDALKELMPQVYEQLHRLANSYMRRENPNHTLQPTALVNEAFLRLTGGATVDWQSRAHFFAVSATVMRRILTDHAKAKKADKRGAGGVRVSFDEQLHFATREEPDMLLLNDALERLAKIDERQAKVVELRYFAGLSIDETAEVLGSSPATVKRDWALAKLWLYRELKTETAD